MPLRSGRNNISYNINELMDTWEKTGEINGDKIATRKEALRKAVAIAMSLAKESKKKEE